MGCSRAGRKSVAEQLILAMAPKSHPCALITAGIRAADKLWVISLGLELQVCSEILQCLICSFLDS